MAVITFILMTVSMVAVGVMVWNALARQERGDADLHERLEADDERAARGRDEFARRRAEAREAKRSQDAGPSGPANP